MRILCLFAVISSLLASVEIYSTEIYKVVDANGNITYTDQPEPEAQLAPLALPAVNKISAAEPGPAGINQPLNAEQLAPPPVFAGYTQAYILSPEHDQIIPNQQRNIIIQLSLQPQLQPGHRVQFLRNGQPQGAPVGATAYQLEDLERGSHQINAQIQTAQGKIILALKPVTIHVQRHFKRQFQ